TGDVGWKLTRGFNLARTATQLFLKRLRDSDVIAHERASPLACPTGGRGVGGEGGRCGRRPCEVWFRVDAVCFTQSRKDAKKRRREDEAALCADGAVEFEMALRAGVMAFFASLRLCVKFLDLHCLSGE